MVRCGVVFPGGRRLSSLPPGRERQAGKPATTLFSPIRLTPVRHAADTGRMNRLFRRVRRHRPHLTVTLYTRTGCHLCDDAKKPVSRAVAATSGAVLRIVNIAGHVDLEVRYGQRIPVVAISTDGEEHVLAEGKISDLRLRRALSALGGES